MDILEVGALCHENKKDTQIAVVVQKKKNKSTKYAINHVHSLLVSYLSHYLNVLLHFCCFSGPSPSQTSYT